MSGVYVMSKKRYPGPRLIGAGNLQRFALAKDIPATQRRECYTRWLIGGIGAWTLMRQLGIELADVEEILREEVYHDKEIIRRRAFADGRLSWVPVREIGLRRAA